MKTRDIFSWWQMEAVTSCPRRASVTAQKDCDLEGKNGPPSVRGAVGVWLQRFGSLSRCCLEKLTQSPNPSSPGAGVQGDFWTVPCPFTHFMLTLVPSCPRLCFLSPFPLCLLLAHQWPLAGEATLQKLEAAISLFNTSSNPASGGWGEPSGLFQTEGQKK